MDMKRILQALDGASTKPVEGASDMVRFLRVVKEADLNQPVATPQQDPNFAKYAQLMAKYDMLSAEMAPDASGVAKNASPEFAQQVAALKAQADQLAGPNAQAWEQARKAGGAPQQSTQQLAQRLEEGANPHKVSLPVQMAMQHYQKPQTVKKSRPALIDKYFSQVEEEQLQEKKERRQLINQYAAVIAERVLMKESFNPNLSPNPGFKPGAGPGIQSAVAEDENQPDVVSLDIPLLIRLLEYAREDAQTDMDLHNVAERLISLSEEGATLTMDDYESIVSPGEMSEGKTIKPRKSSSMCYSNQTQTGIQNKDGVNVAKCTQKQGQKIKHSGIKK